MPAIKISASILSADLGNLNSELEKSKTADCIHMDVMDGHFVPNITFGPIVLKNMKTDLPIKVHLMIDNPEKYVEAFVKAGASMVTVHAEACLDLTAVVKQIKDLGAKAGAAISPDTSVDAVRDVLDLVDYVLVMSVRPGFAGQKFMPEVLDKVKEIRSLKPELDIGMDGGINASNVAECVKAGANVIIAASAIYNGNIEENIALLRERAEAAQK